MAETPKEAIVKHPDALLIMFFQEDTELQEANVLKPIERIALDATHWYIKFFNDKIPEMKVKADLSREQHVSDGGAVFFGEDKMKLGIMFDEAKAIFTCGSAVDILYVDTKKTEDVLTLLDGK
jgi:hypothetical protein